MSTSYTVSSSGLTERDIAVLQGLLSSSSASERIYAYLGEDVFEADVIIVNIDRQDSMQKVAAGRRSFESSFGTEMPPAVIARASVRPESLCGENRALLQLPLVNSRILRLLDLLVIDDSFGFDERTVAEKRRASMRFGYCSAATG